jgi:hypothetical protein
MSDAETDELLAEMTSHLDAMKTRTSDAIIKAKKETYAEIFAGLVSLEKDAEGGFLEDGETSEKMRRFARVYAIIGELKDGIEKYRGQTDTPLEDLGRLGTDRLSAGEVRALWMMVRYADALRELELKKPKLARALLGARSEEKPHTSPFGKRALE